MQRPHSVFSVRDFAYPPTEELHYGVVEAYDGPPWLEDHADTHNDDSEIHGRAIALFDFEPENDNEVRLTEGQVIWISYRHGQGWLVCEDDQGESGLVPEEYVQIIQEEAEDEPKQMLSNLLPDHNSDSDWVDDDVEETDTDTEDLPQVEQLSVK